MRHQVRHPKETLHTDPEQSHLHESIQVQIRESASQGAKERQPSWELKHLTAHRRQLGGRPGYEVCTAKESQVVGQTQNPRVEFDAEARWINSEILCSLAHIKSRQALHARNEPYQKSMRCTQQPHVVKLVTFMGAHCDLWWNRTVRTVPSVVRGDGWKTQRKLQDHNRSEPDRNRWVENAAACLKG